MRHKDGGGHTPASPPPQAPMGAGCLEPVFPLLTVWEMLVLQCLLCDRLSPPRPSGSRTEAPSLCQGRGCCLMLGWEPRRDSLTAGSALWRSLGRICQNPSTQREVRGPNLRAQRSRDPPSPPCWGGGGNAVLSMAAAGAPGRGGAGGQVDPHSWAGTGGPG